MSVSCVSGKVLSSSLLNGTLPNFQEAFHFKTLPLFMQEAERYIQEHLTCMYPVLPAMQGANADLIAGAMAELASLYREDEVSLSQQLVWMELLLERTDTI